MMRNSASKPGRWLSLVAVGVISFLLGDWHAMSMMRPRSTELSPSQNVALRFPEETTDRVAADAATDAPASAPRSMVLGDAQLALLSPAPIGSSPPVSQAPVQATMSEASTARPSPAAAPSPRAVPSAPPLRTELLREVKKAVVESGSRHANRPGYMLNDAQIASIKTRLHLTPDQERMWPAVEAALRNVAYAKARDVQRGGAATAVASLDPNGAAVEGLKSAAVPLIMSFSDEQKNEVRSLAHVMGLDQLASQF
jgi:hypothetical protein